jgi:beta-galactosidase
VGNGTAWYLATRLDEAGTAALADRLTNEAGVRRLERSQPGLELVRRAHVGGASYLFALNRGAASVTVPGNGVDLLSGAQAEGQLTVSAGQAVVLREEPHPSAAGLSRFSNESG